MRHVLLTCKNHPTLRWSCKEIAVNPNGSYNGARGIYYRGELVGLPEYYSDMSGLKGPLNLTAIECDCAGSELTFAPEDAELKAAWEKKYPAAQ